MIQRIQSVWLALAAICGIAMAKAPLFTSVLTDLSKRSFLAAESILIFALSIGIAAMAIIAICLFKNRQTQYKLAISAAFLALGLIGIQVYYIEDFKKANAIQQGTYQWGGLLPIVMTILLFMAAGAIRKDEKLIKSLDRLR
jgi:uncharacterized membrane protein YwaF